MSSILDLIQFLKSSNDCREAVTMSLGRNVLLITENWTNRAFHNHQYHHKILSSNRELLLTGEVRISK